MAASSKTSEELEDFDAEDFDDEFDDDLEAELDDEYELIGAEEVTEEDLAEDEDADIVMGEFADEDEEGAAEPIIADESAVGLIRPRSPIGLIVQAKISVATLPPTSVSRKSRPA